MSFPHDSETRVLIPVILSHGTFVPFYGGEMPELEEGTVADLWVPLHAFRKPAEARKFSTEEIVDLLPAGTPLWALVSRTHGVSGPEDPVLFGRPAIAGPDHGKFLVEFTLRENLKLRLRGTKPGNLERCECLLPGFEDVAVTSLNQAYTRLSERYEPKRKSHTGNAFQVVFYRDPATGKHRPLEELRIKAVRGWEAKMQLQVGRLPLDSLISNNFKNSP
jgi:hypothetical protein